MNSSADSHGQPPLVQLLIQHAQAPHLRASDATTLLSNAQKQDTALADKQLDNGAKSTVKNHANTPSMLNNGFVRFINIDAKSNNRVHETVRHSERNTSVLPHPLHLFNNVDDIYQYAEARATVKLIFVLGLLTTALRALLQSKLQPSVTCYLLIVVVFAFSYLLLLAPHCQKSSVCVTYASHLSFGVTVIAMMLAITAHTWVIFKGPYVGS